MEFGKFILSTSDQQIFEELTADFDVNQEHVISHDDPRPCCFDS